ncbi:MAG: hypothetical protein NVS4B11_21120 [Ktedonobacteraceae bacterium]
MENVVPSILQRLRATDIIRMAGLVAASLGQEYYRIGAVQSTQRQGVRIAGVVNVPHARNKAVAAANAVAVEPHMNTAVSSQKSTQGTAYPVDLELQSVTQWENRCPCGQHPPVMPTICPHAAALLYQWLARPMAFVTDAPPLEIPLHETGGSTPNTDEILPRLSRSLGAPKPALAQRGPAPLNNLADILTQLGLSELRGIAREYEIVTNGANKQQLADAILDELQHPEVVRKVATTLEKPQRQLLAALTLAGGSMTDEDLRGLFERFNLGQPNQLQSVLLALQGKALLFRTSLNSSSHQRIGMNGVLLDIGWYVPVEVRTALHVSAPTTIFDVHSEKNEEHIIQEADPYALLATLLLVARTLDGIQPSSESVKDERYAQLRPAGTFTARTTGPLTGDGSVALPPPADQPASSLITTAQASLPFSAALLRFATRLLRLSDILHTDDKGTPHLRVLSNAAQLLLGPTRDAVLQDLFELWLTHTSYEDLFALEEDGLRLRCRTISLNHPILRVGELEAENSEARQSLIALLAEAPVNQWISFNAFARFVYRINPLFLQRRQRLYASPHWWIEQEEGRPLQPAKLNDWLQAEFHYLSRLLCGPLHWWGVCDLALSREGHLLAFRLTPLAEWLLHGVPIEQEEERSKEPPKAALPTLSDAIEVVNMQDALVMCSVATWSIINTMEAFTEPAGTQQGRLHYCITPKAISMALAEGRHPTALLELLRVLERRTAATTNSPLSLLLAQVERWVAAYGRVRIYTGVHMLETADTVVMRELSATTVLDEQIVRTIHPTLHILKKSGAEQIIDDLKRRGQAPLLHNEV